MTAVKKSQTRSKRTAAANRRTKSHRKHGKQVRFAKPSDGPGSPTDNTGAK
jgi:hypothetical protein